MNSNDNNKLQSSIGNKIVRVSSVIIVAGLDNKFLLIGIRSKDGKLSLPSGHKESSETERECAARELFEETNITAKPDTFTELQKESYEKDGHLCAVSCFCTELVDLPKCDSSKDPDQEFDGLFWTPIIKGKIDPKLISRFTESQRKTIQLISSVPGVKKQLMSTNPIVKINGMWLRKSQSKDNVDIWQVLHKSEKSTDTGLIRIEKKQNKERDIVESVKYKQIPIKDIHDLTGVKAGKWLNTDNMSSLLLALSSHYKNLSVEGKPTGSKHTLEKSISSDIVRTPGQTLSTKNSYLVLQKSTPVKGNEIQSNWAIYMKNGEKVGEVDALHKKGENNLALVYKDFKIPDKVPMVNKDPEQGGDNNLECTFKKFGVKEHIPEVTKGLMHWYIKDDVSFIEAAKKKAEKLEKCMPFFPMSKTEKMRTILNNLKDALKEINKMKEAEGKENIFSDLKPMGAIADFKRKWFHIIMSDGDKKIDINEQEATDYEKDRKQLLECVGDSLPKEVLPSDIKYFANVIRKGGN